MSEPLAKQLAETMDSLLQQFRDFRVDYSTTYRSRLPCREVEIVAKHLDRIGEVFLADDLRHAYGSFRKAVFAKPADPDSLTRTLTDAGEEHLAAMTDENRRLAMEYLRRLGSEEELQRDLQRAADRMVEVLEKVKAAHKTKKRRRKRKDPKAEERKAENTKRQVREDQILREWEGKDEWDSYSDYARWRNADLPEGWPRLTRDEVERAVGAARARKRRKPSNKGRRTNSAP